MSKKFPIYVQNFLHLFPYCHYISKKTYIFAARFPIISAMRQMEDGILFLNGVSTYYLSFLKANNFLNRGEMIR